MLPGIRACVVQYVPGPVGQRAPHVILFNTQLEMFDLEIVYKCEHYAHLAQTQWLFT